MATASRPTPCGSAGCPPLVGRERERVVLHEELVQALQGRGRLVLVGGEAGIGKTTLAREIVREAAAAGACVIAGHCYDLTSAPPYGPWLDLALGYDRADGRPALPTAFEGGRLADVGSQATLFAETLEFLASLARASPVLLLLEDLHWADAASLELLRFLAGRVATLPVLVLVTYRVDELTRRHPLYRQLPGLIRAGSGLRIDLKRLDGVALRELVRASHRLSPEDETRLCAYLERHAEGNPFFAVELMRALEDEGLVSIGREGTTLGPLDRVVLPRLLTQVIDARIDRLGEATRQTLAVAAVIGQEVPLALWPAVAGVGDDELLALIEQAIEAHVLEADRRGDRVRFVHALTRESLYESTLPPRRRAWHRVVADALIDQPHPDPDAVAYHLEQAGDERAAAWLVRAGDRAQRAYAWLAAADRFIAAAGLEHRPEMRRHRGWLLFRAGRMLRLADPARGLDLMRQARQVGIDIGDRVLAADARNSCGLLRCYTNDFAAGVPEFVAGIDELEALPPDEAIGDATVALALADSLPRLEADGDRELASGADLHRRTGMHHRRGGTWVLSSSGHFARAAQVGDDFVRAAAALDHPSTTVRASIGHAYQGLGIALAGYGRSVQAREAFAASRSIHRSIDHDGLIVVCCLAELGWVALDAGADDPAYRRQLVDEAVVAFSNAGGAMAPGLPAAVCRIGVMVADGAWDEAIALADATRQVVPTAGNSYIAGEIAEAVATISLHRGDRDAARREVVAWFPAGPGTPPGARLYRQSLVLQRIAAEVAAAQGEGDEAESWLRANERWLDWAGCTAGRAACDLGWSRLHHLRGESGPARERADAALRRAADPRSPVMLLLAHRQLGELAAGGVAEARRHLRAADDLATVCDLPYQQAMTRVASLELDGIEGRLDPDDTRIEEARAVLQRLGASPALDRLSALGARPSSRTSVPYGLSAREAEVLRLVAQGLTDAAAAQRLFISPRTVGQHLRSIYGKLGVSSRAAATRFAVEHDLA